MLTSFSVDVCLGFLRAGRLRVPTSQRSFRWEDDDVELLFDSIWQGYPIGALLLWKRRAPAARLKIGPVEIDAPATTGAYLVVDGQQRLTALAKVLLPRITDVVKPRYDLYFDVVTSTFSRPQRGRPLPASLIQVRAAFVPSEVLAWLDADRERRKDPAWEATVRELSRRVSEYRIPAFTVESNREAPVRRVFRRMNSSGKPIGEAESFLALYGDQLGQVGLPRLESQLSSAGLGAPEGDDLVPAVKAVGGSIEDAEPGLQRAFRFIQDDLRVPHLRLLPYRYAIAVLTKFFTAHPDPGPRSLALLARWHWRGVVGGGLGRGTGNDVAEMLDAVDGDERATVLRLLSLAGRSGPPNRLQTFNAKTGASRLEALTLARLRPRDLRTGLLIEVGATLSAYGADAFPLVFNRKSLLNKLISNRLLHPPPTGPGESVRKLLAALVTSGRADVDLILESHGFPPAARGEIQRDDRNEVLRLRTTLLKRRVRADIEATLCLGEPDDASEAEGD